MKWNITLVIIIPPCCSDYSETVASRQGFFTVVAPFIWILLKQTDMFCGVSWPSRVQVPNWTPFIIGWINNIIRIVILSVSSYQQAAEQEDLLHCIWTHKEGHMQISSTKEYIKKIKMQGWQWQTKYKNRDAPCIIPYSYVFQHKCMVLQSLLVKFVCHCHPLLKSFHCYQ